MLTKHCISCNQDGHTYIQCKKVPFFDLFSYAVGVPPLAPSLTEQELVDNLTEINAEKENAKSTD